MIELQIRETEFFQSPEQLLIREEQLDQVRQEIEKLPEKTREVFKMATNGNVRKKRFPFFQN